MPFLAMSVTTERVHHISSFAVMDIFNKASELEHKGRHIIHFEIGDPDLPTPECVRQAAIKAIKEDRIYYTPSLELIELHESICQHYHETHGISLSPERILVTSGTAPGLFMVLAALLEPGDEIIMPDLHYTGIDFGRNGEG